MMDAFKKRLMSPARYGDVFILAIFTILITWNPYFAYRKINIFEVGLYLPGIQSILNGEVPFRDFFHLRGPFELYMPALLMRFFGEHLKVLYSYFYFGNVLCLILCVLIAKEIFRTRLVLYLMTLVLVGRTFPRVVYTYWGGMRYAFGLLALWFVIKFFKSNKPRWMFLGGMVTAIAGLTSIEMGAYPFFGVIVAMIISKFLSLQDTKIILKGFAAYLLGFCAIVIPYGTYLFLNSALLPYIDSVLTIVTQMQTVIDPHTVSVYPRNFPEAFVAMTNPVHTNFKHMTPSYLYIFILVYLFVRIRKKTFSSRDLIIICVGIYGFIIYNTGFRGIWAAQFEMALQPEKILLFFLLETFLMTAIAEKEKVKVTLSLRKESAFKWNDRNRWKIYGINAFIFIFVGSSIGYPIQRFNHRFFAFKFARNRILGKDTADLIPLADQETRALHMKRAKGIIVPADQADELEQINTFVEKEVGEKEVVMTYPELGTYNFLVNRRYFDKYPLSTFSWFNDRWHDDYIKKFKSSKPRYLILERERSQNWKDVYLAREENRKKYKDIMDMIPNDYKIIEQTPLSDIYELKETKR